MVGTGPETETERSSEDDTGRFEQEPKSTGTLGLFLFDFLKIFVIAMAIIVPVRWFLFQPFVVTGDSMEPNFVDGDYLIIDEISYRFKDPRRGEVVVLRFPNDPSQFFIKRVIGLPGERVMIRNGRVSVTDMKTGEGVALRESYVPDDTQTFGNIDLILEKQEYFVLGDNRLSSSDSRLWGPLQRKFIVGRVVLRAFPVSDFEFYTPPVYSSGN